MGEVDETRAGQNDPEGVASAADPDADWWTMEDIAAYLGVKLRTVHTYRLRAKDAEDEQAGGLPAADKMFGRTPVWKPKTIIEWPRPGRGAGGGRPRKS